MRKIAVITSFVLGMGAFGATASAQVPRWDYDRDRWDYDRDRWGYDRDRWDRDRDRPWDRDRYDRDDWREVPLATTSVGPRQRLWIGADVGRFSRLRLETVRGQPYIRFLVVRFANGDRQRIQLDRRLYSGQAVEVDLQRDNRRIESIAISGVPDRWSRVTITGLR